ncbi:MAG: DUF308 domain-containing protein [Bacteroidales bacterium]|nr:DUF308 domain-containing protein [Bacteroidales bacterium]
MKLLAQKWIFILLNATLVIAFGLVLVIVPLEFLKKLVFIVGAIIAFVGLLLVFGAFNYAKENKSMVFWLFQGVFNLVIGAIVMFNTEASVKFLLILAGLWAIILGVYQFSVGLIRDSQLTHKNVLRINGLVAIALGLLLIFAPELLAGIMIQIFGFVIILVGSGMLFFAFILRKLGKKEEEYQLTKDTNISYIEKETNP